MFKIKHGFTLAEMMVVMLILSIIMAAMAPVMTTRNKLDQSSPWVWAENGSDAYYGLGDAQVAMIGQQKAEDTDTNARLIINAGDNKDHILFKTDDDVLGRLKFKDTNISLGTTELSNISSGGYNIAIGVTNPLGRTTSGCSNIAIGDGALASNTTGSSNTAIGDDAIRASATASNNTGVGYYTLYNNTGSTNTALGSNSLYYNTSGESNVAVGAYSSQSNTTGIGNTSLGTYSQLNNTSGSYNTALGYDSLRDNNGGSYNTSVGSRNNYDEFSRHTVTGTTVVGSNSSAWGGYGIAVGYNTQASGDHSVAVGTDSKASGSYSTALGSNAQASSDDSIAIGEEAQSTAGASVAFGRFAQAVGETSIAIGGNTGISSLYDGTFAVKKNSIAIGTGALSRVENGIAIGYNASTSESKFSPSTKPYPNSIAIGTNAHAEGDNVVAIGSGACTNVSGPNKVCIGANSGPAYGSSLATDSVERIFIGSKPNMKNLTGLKDGSAPLEIHNDPDYGATVVVNGTLIVRGYIAASPTLYRDTRLSTLSISGRGTDDVLFVRGEYVDGGSPYSSNGYLRNYWVSDRRLKYVGKESTSGLEKIKQLKVFNYTFKQDEKKTPHVGVIAQDLQTVFPEAVTKAKDGFLRIRFEDMFYAMINAIKELDSRITALEKENQELKEILKQVQNDNRKLNATLNRIQDDNKKFEARLKALEAKIK